MTTDKLFTAKQQALWHSTISSPKRWNISVGAVRSGKTYLDLFRIPYRIMHAGEGGIALIGNTCGSLERNILAPMRKMYTEKYVGRISAGGKVRLFGRECYATGAYCSACADKLRGMSLAYCYGDEITTWNETVFEMVKSRLDRPYSVFDGSCNPDSPFHWFKRFLDSGSEDIAQVHFTIDDNTALSRDFVDALKNEYRGTVYYDRFILGLWKCAEGSIYPMIASAPDKFITDDTEGIVCADMGVDFGGSGSATAFALTGYTAGAKRIITLDEYYTKKPLTPAALEREFVNFVRRALTKYRLRDVYCDSAEQVLIRGLKNAALRERLPVEIHNARKGSINERIRFYTAIAGSGRYFIARGCRHTLEAFCTAVWDNDRRLDDGSTNIDSLDAQEYSTENRMRDILDLM
ncbi:MAG: terminase family protein [Oscillospiraceae bacterium]|nr:terminase family protein [Oscillospiraceae bacterium]